MADNDKRDPKAEPAKAAPRRVSAAGRQDGNYKVEFTNPPKGGPVPPYRPIDSSASNAE